MAAPGTEALPIFVWWFWLCGAVRALEQMTAYSLREVTVLLPSIDGRSCSDLCCRL